jgi:hypothetical protein
MAIHTSLKMIGIIFLTIVSLNHHQAKGQLISKCPFGVFKSIKKPTNIFGFLP